MRLCGVRRNQVQLFFLTPYLISSYPILILSYPILDLFFPKYELFCPVLILYSPYYTVSCLIMGDGIREVEGVEGRCMEGRVREGVGGGGVRGRETE